MKYSLLIYEILAIHHAPAIHGVRCVPDIITHIEFDELTMATATYFDLFDKLVL